MGGGVILFLLLHFWIYRSSESGNRFAFSTLDACTLFFYTIPNLLNTIIIIYFELNKEDKKINPLLWFFIYLGIFSNLYATYNIAIYAFLKIVWYIKDNKKFDLKDNKRYIAILVLFVLSALIELTGGRSNGGYTSIFEQFPQVFNYAKIFFKSFNKWFVLFCVVLFVAFIATCIKNKDNKLILKQIRLIEIYILSVLYIFVLSAKVNVGYFNRQDVFIGVVSIGLINLIWILQYLFKNYPVLENGLLILILIVLFNTNTTGRTFADSNGLYIYWRDAHKLESYIVDKVIEADKNDETEVTIKIPKYNSANNWPITTDGSMHICYALYKHGIIDSYINIKLIPVENFTY